MDYLSIIYHIHDDPVLTFTAQELSLQPVFDTFELIDSSVYDFTPNNVTAGGEK